MEFHNASNFADLIELLKKSRRSGSAEFSYHQLAKKLAFRSPRSIAMVRKGQRPPSGAMVRSICDFLQATPKEREFISLLADKSRLQKKMKSTQAIDEKLENYRQARARAIQGYTLPGVSIEIDASVPSDLKKRLTDLISELIQEFGTKTDRVEK